MYKVVTSNVGMNDLTTPFFVVFLSEVMAGDVFECDPETLDKHQLDYVEAMCYWCLSKLIERIQDNYTYGQPGIIKQLEEMSSIIERADNTLYKHLASEQLEFLQFGFRWMNCLLIREFELHQVIRMWDTYLSEGRQGLRQYHVYVCAAFLLHYRQQLIGKDFGDMIHLLQQPDTKLWNTRDIQSLLSQAFVLQSQYK